LFSLGYVDSSQKQSRQGRAKDPSTHGFSS
jgi:hypothetical protein